MASFRTRIFLLILTVVIIIVSVDKFKGNSFTGTVIRPPKFYPSKTFSVPRTGKLFNEEQGAETTNDDDEDDNYDESDEEDPSLIVFSTTTRKTDGGQGSEEDFDIDESTDHEYVDGEEGYYEEDYGNNGEAVQHTDKVNTTTTPLNMGLKNAGDEYDSSQVDSDKTISHEQHSSERGDRKVAKDDNDNKASTATSYTLFDGQTSVTPYGSEFKDGEFEGEEDTAAVDDYNEFSEQTLNARQEWEFTEVENFTDLSATQPTVVFTAGPSLDKKFTKSMEIQGHDMKATPRQGAITDQGIFQHRIADMCGGRNKSLMGRTNAEFVNFNTFVNLKYHILYCQIQKVGSTFWKQILEYVHRKDVKRYKSPHEVTFNDLSLTKLGTDKKSRNDIYKNSFKFMFVRDPFERLFSGYVDKFFAPNLVYWNELGKYIQNITRDEKYHSRCGSDISFREFVYYVLVSETSGVSRERHFTSQYEHCRPCENQYDFIGKMENFIADGQFVLKTIENLSNISVSLDDLQNHLDNDTIYDLIQRLYEPIARSKIIHCESFHTGMMRVWRTLQIRGILSKDAPMPFAPSVANQIPKSVFEHAVFRAYKSFGQRNQRKTNRNEALQEAYLTLPGPYLQRIVQVFKFDFELFGYDADPNRLLKFSNQTSDFKYLQL